jgi:hypothetical protein
VRRSALNANGEPRVGGDPIEAADGFSKMLPSGKGGGTASGSSRPGRTGCRPDLPVRGTGGMGSALEFKEFKECKNCIMQKVHLA